MDAPRPPRARLLVTFVLGVAPLVLGWIADTGVDRFGGLSVLALCAIPWVFLSSMPRGIGPRAPFTSEIAGLGLALPTFAAGAGLDMAQGAGGVRTLILGAFALVTLLVLGDSARRAASSARSATAHAIVWFALVPGPCLLVYALQTGGGPFLGAAPDAVRFLAGGSPLGFLVANVGAVGASLWLSPALAAMHLAAVGLVAAAASTGKSMEPSA